MCAHRPHTRAELHSVARTRLCPSWVNRLEPVRVKALEVTVEDATAAVPPVVSMTTLALAMVVHPVIQRVESKLRAPMHFK